MASDYSPLSAFIIRSLSDKVYDKRKSAAGEVARAIKEFVAKGESEQIHKVISHFTQMILEQNPNSRIGGLMGLAAVSVGLGVNTIVPYMSLLVAPTLPSFKDHSPHVRYYATEALYNVAIVARGAILDLLHDIFGIIIDLSMDKDPNVRNGSDLLDRAMKSIIVESPAFDLVSFMPVFREKLYVNDVASQTRVVSWITLLQGIPDVSLVPFLPEILDGIFIILASPKIEVKKMTEVVLGEFTAAIRKKPQNVDFELVIRILNAHAQSSDALVQMISLLWILDCVKLSKRTMLPYSAGIIRSAVPCIAYDDPALTKSRGLAEEICQNLLELITPEDDLKDGEQENTELEESQDEDKKGKSLKLNSIVKGALMKQLEDDTPVACKTMALRIIYHLNNKVPYRMQSYVNMLFPFLLRCVSDSSDEVVILAIQVLAHIASSQFPASARSMGEAKESVATASLTESPAAAAVTICTGTLDSKESFHGGEYFSTFIQSLLKLFSSESQVLKDRAIFIIRHLCVMLSPEEVYFKFAELLLREENLSFASKMVQKLSAILLTSKELSFLRRKLRDLDKRENCELFVKLYRSWCHSPVATLTLCLLSQKYEHAATLVRVFGELDVTTDFLVELDGLIQMIESPIFTFLRLQLLSPGRHPALVESLYGILMLLPQTEVFHLLRSRLNCVPPAHLVRAPCLQAPKSESEDSIDFLDLLSHFHATQKRHQAFQEKEIIERLQSTMVISDS